METCSPESRPFHPCPGPRVQAARASSSPSLWGARLPPARAAGSREPPPAGGAGRSLAQTRRAEVGRIRVSARKCGRAGGLLTPLTVPGPSPGMIYQDHQTEESHSREKTERTRPRPSFPEGNGKRKIRDGNVEGRKEPLLQGPPRARVCVLEICVHLGQGPHEQVSRGLSGASGSSDVQAYTLDGASESQLH
ncbi:uncharacterized protein LOC118145662 [Callithrix jacchus]